jgi:hypothetical protein
MTIRKDGRCMIQLTMGPDLYKAVREHCRKLDKPVTVWARDLMHQALSADSPPPPTTP